MAEWTPLVFSIVATLFGLIATTLMGMAISRLASIDDHLEKLNGKVFAHITASHVHEAGIARMEEQLKRVEATAIVSHTRVDRLEERIR